LTDVEGPPHEVDVIDIQAHTLGSPETTPIEQLQHTAISQVGHRSPGKAVEQCLDFGLRERVQRQWGLTIMGDRERP
jgi:hypothetical protein